MSHIERALAPGEEVRVTARLGQPFKRGAWTLSGSAS